MTQPDTIRQVVRGDEAEAHARPGCGVQELSPAAANVPHTVSAIEQGVLRDVVPLPTEEERQLDPALGFLYSADSADIDQAELAQLVECRIKLAKSLKKLNVKMAKDVKIYDFIDKHKKVLGDIEEGMRVILRKAAEAADEGYRIGLGSERISDHAIKRAAEYRKENPLSEKDNCNLRRLLHHVWPVFTDMHRCLDSLDEHYTAERQKAVDEAASDQENLTTHLAKCSGTLQQLNRNCEFETSSQTMKVAIVAQKANLFVHALLTVLNTMEEVFVACRNATDDWSNLQQADGRGKTFYENKYPFTATLSTKAFRREQAVLMMLLAGHIRSLQKFDGARPVVIWVRTEPSGNGGGFILHYRILTERGARAASGTVDELPEPSEADRSDCIQSLWRMQFPKPIGGPAAEEQDAEERAECRDIVEKFLLRTKEKSDLVQKQNRRTWLAVKKSLAGATAELEFEATCDNLQAAILFDKDLSLQQVTEELTQDVHRAEDDVAAARNKTKQVETDRDRLKKENAELKKMLADKGYLTDKARQQAELRQRMESLRRDQRDLVGAGKEHVMSDPVTAAKFKAIQNDIHATKKMMANAGVPVMPTEGLLKKQARRQAKSKST